ncbi:hypothetical protein [Thalassotalea sp. ND16A]|uniref:hypothetical protein n=1 Tax=Thalassotalea sp. ND16A TaxID=1535422 RepID=UPI00051A0B98|nr:hypothetical protein [Thalassotalea sp. ND16A]KGK01013.1 hypothetical protein ND16A_3215 [Thalassotalea sp. ND16A]
MKTLAATLLGLTVLAAPAACLASQVNAAVTPQQMPVYEVVYVDSVNVVSQQTEHTLQALHYQNMLDVRASAKNNIEYIGARLHLNASEVAKVTTIAELANVAE